jgi:uracil-DNA glycosylase
MALRELNEQIMNCRKCRLWKDARHAVPGEGPENAAVMLIGQNPGEEEDKVGRPFVGRAGKFLNEVLAENGIKRQELFVTNIVKHKTPNNRKPLTDEIEPCVPYLVAQIREIQPKLVVLMGEVAWRTPRKEGVTYFETYHPAAAMRFPRAREKFKRDFAKIKTFIQDLG